MTFKTFCYIMQFNGASLSVFHKFTVGNSFKRSERPAMPNGIRILAENA